MNGKSRLLLCAAGFLSLSLIMMLTTCGNGDDDPTTPTAPGANKAYTVGSVTFNLKYCPGGTFPTGIGDSGEQTESAFWIGETEVTYELWDTVYTWAMANGYSFANAGVMGDGTGDTNQHPVTTVNWRDAMVWCNAVSEMAGLSPVYKNGGTVVRDSQDTNAAQCDGVAVDGSANGFRLPGSMEWECAARYRGSDSTNAVERPTASGKYWTKGNSAAGATGKYDTAATGAVAWYSDNSGSSTHAVKGKTANTLGAYDMSGNVWEWCFDDSGSARVARGGSWGTPASALQVGDVAIDGPDVENGYLGFRLSRTAE